MFGVRLLSVGMVYGIGVGKAYGAAAGCGDVTVMASGSVVNGAAIGDTVSGWLVPTESADGATVGILVGGGLISIGTDGWIEIGACDGVRVGN